MNMREIMRVIEDVIPFKRPEGSIDPGETPPVRDTDAPVDLHQHKMNKAVSNYADVIGGLAKREWDFFAGGKFGPFAKTYIDSDFNPKFQPTIELTVRVRDYQPSPEARTVLRDLRSQGFKYVPRTQFAKGHKPKDNPDQYGYGPWVEKMIDLRAARELFQTRDQSPYGTYQPSEMGFRTSYKRLWDTRGLGFNLVVGGYDTRRGDKYGNDTRQEHHVIDDDTDMTEVVNMFAAIQRSHIKSAS